MAAITITLNQFYKYKASSTFDKKCETSLSKMIKFNTGFKSLYELVQNVLSIYIWNVLNVPYNVWRNAKLDYKLKSLENDQYSMIELTLDCEELKNQVGMFIKDKTTGLVYCFNYDNQTNELKFLPCNEELCENPFLKLVATQFDGMASLIRAY